MTNVIMKIAPPNSHNFSSAPSIYPFPFVSTNSISSLSYSNNKIDLLPLRRRYIKAFTNSVQHHLDSSLHLEPISTESHFDQLISHPQPLQELLVIVWMASWCRKCIYLKPKLQKLAADYFPRVRFYCIDVNNVPHKLVVRAGVTKMPTVQVWKDGKKQGEVIGGHKAYLVVNEVREMIENEQIFN